MNEPISEEEARDAAVALLLFENSHKKGFALPSFSLEDIHVGKDNVSVSSDNSKSYTAGPTDFDFNISRKPHYEKWTEEEDANLHKAVSIYGESNWTSISQIVRTKDKLQCRQRWQKVIRPGIKKGKWTVEEDEELRRVVSYLHSIGINNWRSVAERLPHRTSKQCRERWNHHLCPGISKDEYSPEEDRKLAILLRIHGTKWSKIAKEMPGRTENSVRSRLQGLRNEFLSNFKGKRKGDKLGTNDSQGFDGTHLDLNSLSTLRPPETAKTTSIQPEIPELQSIVLNDDKKLKRVDMKTENDNLIGKRKRSEQSSKNDNDEKSESFNVPLHDEQNNGDNFVEAKKSKTAAKLDTLKPITLRELTEISDVTPALLSLASLSKSGSSTKSASVIKSESTKSDLIYENAYTSTMFPSYFTNQGLRSLQPNTLLNMMMNPLPYSPYLPPPNSLDALSMNGPLNYDSKILNDYFFQELPYPVLPGHSVYPLTSYLPYHSVNMNGNIYSNSSSSTTNSGGINRCVNEYG